MVKKKKDDESAAATSDGSMAVNDAWTGLLAISLFALAVGTGFLLWDASNYWGVDPPKPPMISQQKPAQPAPPPAPGKDGGEKKGDEKDKTK